MAQEPASKDKKKKTALTLTERTSLNELLAKLNEEYAVIQRGSQVLIMRHWISETGESKIQFYKRNDFLLLMENQLFFFGEGEKPVNIGKSWLSWPHRKTYEEIYFDPGGEERENSYNLWRGFRENPKIKPRRPELFFKHVEQNICSGEQELIHWLYAWVSDIFQHPARKIGTAVVMRGEMGVGKGIFANTIGKLLGVHYMSISQPSQLTGKFNGHMMDKLLMFVDEGWWSDEREGAGTLNTLITEPLIAIEMKGKDAVFIVNYTRFIVASNADMAVMTGLHDERRFAFYDVMNTNQQDTDFFSGMLAELNNGGYEYLLDFFLHYEYDEGLPRKIPHTEGLSEHRIYSMPNHYKWWHGCLMTEKIGEFKLTNNNPPDNNIPVDDFYKAYYEDANLTKYKPFAKNILPKRLKTIIDFNKTGKLTNDGERQYYYLAAISDLRRKFEEKIGHKIDWNEF